MNKLLYLIFSFFHLTNAANWAVLVAGSNTFMNYRHQADVCHAYQLLHNNNIPDSNIIVMMYDDIAYNSLNPYKGVIINEPNGYNVYENVLKDYVGEDVNPTTFIGVLTGNKTMAKGKVLNTGSDDTIFLYFVGYGGPGFISFGNQRLYSHELKNILFDLYSANKFSLALIYMDSSFSGSIFTGELIPNMFILAITSTNPIQLNYACYWDEKIGVYLADVFSINWLINTGNQMNIDNETIGTQFKILRNETNNSTVCSYGDMNIFNLLIKQFFGINNGIKNIIHSNKITDFIQTDHIKLKTLINFSSKSEINDEILSIKKYDEMFKEKYDLIKKYKPTNCHVNQNDYIDTICLKNLIDKFEQMNGQLTEYGMKYMAVFAEECKLISL